MNEHASTLPRTRRPIALIHRVAASLPHGRTLPEGVWLQRHYALLAILWIHVPALTIFALARGYSPFHAFLHGAPLAALAVLAMVVRGNRRFASAVVSFGLITSSAVLVHTWGGVIEGHFHFFVMIALLALYEDWLPFLLAAAYVVVHHGLMGALEPGAVYNHADAAAHPWKWALIHGMFVAAAGAASVAAWRLNEDMRAETLEAYSRARESEMAVSQSQQQLAEAQKLAHVGSWEWDVVSGEVSWSDELYRIFGLEPQTWRPDYQGFIERVHPDERARVEAAVQASVANREAFRDEHRVVRPNGEERVIESHGEIVLGDDGEPAKLVGSAQDVTERRQVEVELQVKREAEREHRTKSEFLSRISHELRTPLNAILGFAQVLELGDLNPDEQQSVRQILKGGTHLLELINEVLEISRVESGNMSVSLEPVCVAEIVSDALDLVGPLAAQHGVTLHNRAAEKACCHVHADKQRFKQVMLNLLSNGIKYNREGGSVTVLLEEVRDDRVFVMVKDTGKGIPEDKLAQVFNPFDRLGAEQTSIEGTGLGLTLSKLLVEGMGGTLSVDSEPWIGSTFIVSLPASEAADGTGSADKDRVVPAISPNGSNGVTILYVEDNLSNFKLVERLLAGRSETRLLTAMEGNLGLELARHHLPDLILLDLHLPVMDGHEVLRRLQADPLTSEIPVVVVSADATSSRVEQLLASGATAFLTKPLDVKRFAAVVDDALSQGIAA